MSNDQPSKEELNFSNNENDELVNVRLPKVDYEIMREIIRRQKVMGWLASWFKPFIFTFIGGIIILFTFGSHLKHIIKGWLG